MRMRIGTVAAVAGLTLALGASASRAAIVETIINTDLDLVRGSITFPTPTGDSAAGVLFSFVDFTQADITSISWSLDPDTNAVVALDLDALQGDNPCPNGGTCANKTLSMSPSLAALTSNGCTPFECGGSVSQEDIRFAPVPEPSTWALMIVGFVGLGLAARRSSRQRGAAALRL